MEIEADATRLVVRLSNRRPVELVDLTKSLLSLANSFERYVSAHGTSKETREAALYVKEIRSGSIEIELIDLAAVTMLPFVENFNTVFDFAKHLKAVFDYHLQEEGEKPELLPAEYKEISSFINPIAQDIGSNMVIYAEQNAQVRVEINVNSTEANAVQNQFKHELEQLKHHEDGEIKHRVLMGWYQARNDVKAKSGNKGVIEEISPDAKNITFATDELQKEILQGDKNFFSCTYEVDVKIQKLRDEIKAYQVLAVHQIFDE